MFFLNQFIKKNILKDKFFIFLILIIFPYIYLFPLTFGFLVMGNDFEGLYFSYKKFIFDFFIQDIFIYWSPSESAGYSLIFNPFAQYFYIPGWLLLFIHKFLDLEFTRHNFLLYNIFAISIFNIGNYLWLRKLNINSTTALISCLVISMSLKISEILRFPNAIHSFCWFSWILYGITLTKFKNETSKSFVIIFLSWLFILTAGYPYYIIYSLVLFLFYFIFISLNNFRYIVGFDYNNRSTLLNSFKRTCYPTLLSSMIAFPWLYKVKEILNITKDRNLRNFEFTNWDNSNFLEHLGSWTMPTISIAEGWFYNGIITTFLILFFLIGNFFKNNHKQLYLIFSFFIFYLFVYELSKAGDSFLFNLIVEKFDFLKNLRAWSRINIIIIPFLTLLIAFSIDYFKETSGKKYQLIIFVFVSIIILLIQFNFINYNENSYWNNWQSKRINFVSEWFKEDLIIFSKFVNLYQGKIYFIYGLISFLIILIYQKINNKFFSYILILIVFSELFFLSNIQWALPGSSWSIKYNNEKNMIKILNESFDKASYIDKVYGNVYYKRNNTYSVNYIENFGYDSHSKVFDNYLDRKGIPLENITNYKIKDFKTFFAANETGNVKRVFFTKSIDYSNLHDFLRDHEKNEGSKVKIIKKFYSGNTLELEVVTNSSGYITFVDNYDPNWFVKVNNNKTKLLKFLDSYKSVKIKQGKSKVIFYYNPWQIKL